MKFVIDSFTAMAGTTPPYHQCDIKLVSVESLDIEVTLTIKGLNKANIVNTLYLNSTEFELSELFEE